MDPAQTVAHYRLPARDFERLDTFVDTCTGFEHALGDQSVLFSGAGSMPAPAEVVAEMAAFAQRLLVD
jgi:hypothetical protein